jgi:hypothetical protein
VASELIVARRLRAQRLTGALCPTPEEAVGRLLGVQAQDYLSAKWSVGARVAGATDASVEEAFAAGRIVRTHVLRPTWHFVLPADIRWLLTATAPRILARDRRRYAELRLDRATLRRANGIFAAALRGGNALTRAEMAAALEEGRVSPAGQRMPYLLMHAELDALVCSGPRRGRQQTYMLLEERVPDGRTMPRDEALSELAVRFFAGHGPATLKDLARWASLTVAEVRAAVGHSGDRLRREEIGGLELWSAASRPERVPVFRPGAPLVHLVQGYDEHLMGHIDSRSLLVRPGSSWVAATPPAGRLVILLDGRVAGFWRRTFAKDRVAVEVELLDDWSAAAHDALRAEVDRYAAFLGLPASLKLAEE